MFSLVPWYKDYKWEKHIPPTPNKYNLNNKNKIYSSFKEYYKDLYYDQYLKLFNIEKQKIKFKYFKLLLFKNINQDIISHIFKYFNLEPNIYGKNVSQETFLMNYYYTKIYELDYYDE